MPGNSMTIKLWNEELSNNSDYYLHTVGFGLQKLIKSKTKKRLLKLASTDFVPPLWHYIFCVYIYTYISSSLQRGRLNKLLQTKNE